MITYRGYEVHFEYLPNDKLRMFISKPMSDHVIVELITSGGSFRPALDVIDGIEARK